MIRESAPAKVNLVLHLGPLRADGRHEICSLVGSIELADTIEVELRGGGADAADRVDCPGVPPPNLAAEALAAYRAAAPHALPPLAVRIEKRIPIAAGLGGGSADAAAVLRAADALVERPLGPRRLHEIAASIGADVPAQLVPGHALVMGAGERVEPAELPPLSLVLVPQAEGLATGWVYAEADRLSLGRRRLEPARVRALLAPSVEPLLAALENDLEPAALSLRPELTEVAERLRRAGADAALVSGSGPTTFGVFVNAAAARAAADGIEGAILTRLRAPTARAYGDEGAGLGEEGAGLGEEGAGSPTGAYAERSPSVGAEP